MDTEPRIPIKDVCPKCGLRHYNATDCDPMIARIEQLKHGLVDATRLLEAALKKVEQLQDELRDRGK